MGEFDINKFPDLKSAVDKYTSAKKKKPITRWSNTSLTDKLAVIDQAGEININVFIITLAAFYDDASEALHATLYGLGFHTGIFEPKINAHSPEEISNHCHRCASMLFCLFGLLLGVTNSFVAKTASLPDVLEDVTKTTNQINREIDLSQEGKATQGKEGGYEVCS